MVFTDFYVRTGNQSLSGGKQLAKTTIKSYLTELGSEDTRAAEGAERISAKVGFSQRTGHTI